MHGEHYDPGLWNRGFEEVDRFYAVNLGHVDVHQNDLRSDPAGFVDAGTCLNCGSDDRSMETKFSRE